MTTISEHSEIVGEFRYPRNTAAGAKGSIHDDATASRLGFRGGTVAGSLHMDQFAPILIALFGNRWFERGNLSLYFRQATVDREMVRCFGARLDDGPRARVRMENEAGDLISEGGASCLGADQDTELGRRVKAQVPSTTLRILGRCSVGDRVADIEGRVSDEALQGRLETVVEPLPGYRGAGPWAGRVLPPSLCVHLMTGVQKTMLPLAGPTVGLYGAIELQFLNGPLFAETDYRLDGEILALSESPKTENVWYRTRVRARPDGPDLAWMIMYLRFLKASSPLWS